MLPYTTCRLDIHGNIPACVVLSRPYGASVNARAGENRKTRVLHSPLYISSRGLSAQRKKRSETENGDELLIKSH